MDSSGGKYPSEANLLPGDLLYYKGTDKSQPYQVGHVELFIGDGKLLGHGSGAGPTVKNLKTYSHQFINFGITNQLLIDARPLVCDIPQCLFISEKTMLFTPALLSKDIVTSVSRSRDDVGTLFANIKTLQINVIKNTHASLTLSSASLLFRKTFLAT